MYGSCLCCDRPILVCSAERERAAETATVKELRAELARTEEMRAEIARLRKELDKLKDLVERMRRQTTVYR